MQMGRKSGFFSYRIKCNIRCFIPREGEKSFLIAARMLLFLGCQLFGTVHVCRRKVIVPGLVAFYHARGLMVTCSTLDVFPLARAAVT